MEKNTLYDFYYSPTLEVNMKRASRMTGQNYYDSFINGKKYTEMVKHGKEPVAVYPDNKIIATDYGNKVTAKQLF